MASEFPAEVLEGRTSDKNADLKIGPFVLTWSKVGIENGENSEMNP